MWVSLLFGGLGELTGGLWEAWTPFMRSAYSLAYFQNRAERVDWNCMGGWLVSCDCPSTHPSLSLATASASLGWGLLQLSRKLSCEKQKQLRPKACLSRVGAAITGTYTGSTSEQPWFLSVVRQPQFAPRPTPSAHASPSCPSTAPLLGKNAGAGIEEKTHFRGMEPAQTQPSKLLLHAIYNSQDMEAT